MTMRSVSARIDASLPASHDHLHHPIWKHGHVQEVAQSRSFTMVVEQDPASEVPAVTSDGSRGEDDGWEGQDDEHLPLSPILHSPAAGKAHDSNGWDAEDSPPLPTRTADAVASQPEPASAEPAAGAQTAPVPESDATGASAGQHAADSTSQPQSAAASSQVAPAPQEGWDFDGEDPGWEEPAEGALMPASPAPAAPVVAVVAAAGGQPGSELSACRLHACWAALLSRAIACWLPALVLQWLDGWHSHWPWPMTLAETRGLLAEAQSSGLPVGHLGCSASGMCSMISMRGTCMWLQTLPLSCAFRYWVLLMWCWTAGSHCTVTDVHRTTSQRM